VGVTEAAIGRTDPVLLYHPDGYRIDREDLKGRHSAGASFLSAFLERCDGPEVFALCDKREHYAEFARTVEACGRPLTARHVGRTDAARLREQALLFVPHPQLANEARLRSFIHDAAYALCGITHTVSSQRIVESIADFAVGPVMPWDALICTSPTALGAVSAMLDAAEESLRARLGATRFTRPLMPVIPLGVDTRRFRRNDTDRKAWRDKLKLGADTVAILFFGRLSYHAKASPFQLAQAAELASRLQPNPLAILWCGRFSGDANRDAFMTTARSMAPSVAFHHVDGRDARAASAVWSAADIFCSLSDNVQETFGLTVIEAMAAELPVVASNWNGYRDSIQHEVDGVLIETAMPVVPLTDLAYRHVAGLDSYDAYVGGLSQFCVVDMGSAAHWLARLAGDAGLRRKLGTAAGQSVARKFDWSVVLPRYRALWDEQRAQLARARADNAPGSQAWRLYDPAIAFSGYPSSRIPPEFGVARGPLFANDWDKLIRRPGMVANPHVLVGTRQLKEIEVAFGDDHPVRIKDLLERFSPDARTNVFRSLHWLVKIGLLRFGPMP
jgi:glycosyltransferase involved in cell wall biosynthesis